MNNSLKNQSDAVLYFIQKLDIEMIDSILLPNFTYLDLDKSTFIEKLGDAFDEFKQSGDEFLNIYPGFCNSQSCRFKHTGFTFIGNKSNNYFDLIIEISDGVVNTIFECTEFKCQSDTIVRKKRIEIDDSAMLPF